MQNAQDNTNTAKPKSKALLFCKIFACLAVIIGIAYISGLFDSIQKVFVMIPRIHCQENLLTINRIARFYTEDNDGKLPPADKWQEVFINEYNINPKTFICPSAHSKECTYAMNINVAGKNINEIPKDTVLFFEIEGGSKLYGGPELLTARHSLGNNINVSSIVFADGHVELVRMERYDKLRWKPEEED